MMLRRLPKNFALQLVATVTFLLLLIAAFILPRILSNQQESSPVSPSGQDLGSSSATSSPRTESLDSLCVGRPSQVHLDSRLPWIPLAGNLTAPAGVTLSPDRSSWAPHVCVVAQTTSADSPFSTTFSIDRFVASWLAQTNPNWKLVLVDFSSFKNESFQYLQGYMGRFIREADVYRISITNATNPSPDVAATTENYNGASIPLQTLLRAAKQFCPLDTKRLVFAEASDWYHPDFTSSILDPSSADVVGVDFFTNDALERRGVARESRSCIHIMEEPPCSCNDVAPEGAYIGSLGFDFSKFSAVDPVVLSEYAANCTNRSPPVHDWQSCVLHYLLSEKNWTRSRVGHCLLSSAPNPHLCALYGHVTAHTTTFSSSDFMCVPSKDTAELLIQEDVEQFKVPFFESSCFHASRFGSERTLTAPSSTTGKTRSSNDSPVDSDSPAL